MDPLQCCVVCKEFAKPNTVHLCHYGGVVCFSCRHFFRRAFCEQNKVPQFICKSNGGCTVDTSTRRRCQKCRLDLCIRAGMQPHAVLTDEQKNHRFRKMLKKRKQIAEETLSADFAPAAKIPSIHSPIQNQTKNTNVSDKSTQATPETNWPRYLLDKVEEIGGDFLLSLHQMETDATKILHSKLSSIQQGDPNVVILRQELLHEMVTLVKQFHHFAILQRPFRRLGRDLQLKILSRATPQYLQLWLATFLLPDSISTSLPLTKEEFCYSKILWFNTITRLFKPGADLKYFVQLINKLKDLNLKSLEVRSVLAYIILFYRDDIETLNDYFFLESCAVIADPLFCGCFKPQTQTWSGPRIDLDQFMVVITRMAQFSANNIAWRDQAALTSENHRTLGIRIFETNLHYTLDEDLWMSNTLNLVDDALRSVTQGEEQIREFLLISMGVAPSKEFVVRGLRTFHERIWKVLVLHPDFKNLPSAERLHLYKTIGPIGLALVVAKQENNQNGIKQIQEGYGPLSRSQIQKGFLSTSNQPNLKKKWRQANFMDLIGEVKKVGLNDLTASRTNDSCLPQQQQQQLTDYSKSVETLAELLQDQTLYRMLLLLILSMPAGMPNVKNQVHRMHNFYNKSLFRKLIASKENGSKGNSYTQRRPEEIMFKMYRVVNDLERMSKTLMYYLGK